MAFLARTRASLSTLPKQDTFDYVRIVVGAIMAAMAIDMFLVPNKVAAGGVTGISIILHHTLGTPVGFMILLINIPIVYVGWKYGGGRRFLTRTLTGIAVLSLATDLLAPILPTPTSDRLLVIFYGGILEGFGLALVFHGRGTTGGADIAGRLANRYLGLEIGKTMLSINLFVYAWAGIVFGAEPVMVAFARAFVASKTLDAVLVGFSATRAAFIISSKSDIVRDSILKNLKRGVTVLSGSGGYTGVPRPVLFVVVTRSEVTRLKHRVMEVDPHAFISISPAQDLVGGFPLPRPQ